MIKMCSVGCKKVIFTRCVCSVAQLCPTLCDLMDYGPPDHCHGILQARILGVDCHSLLQGIFLTQRSNVGLLHCRWILYHPSHQGSPIFLPYFLLVKWSHSVMSNSLWPHDCSLPDSSVHGIFQARVLEWVAISFSRGSSWPRDWTQVSCILGRHFTIWALVLIAIMMPFCISSFQHLRKVVYYCYYF